MGQGIGFEAVGGVAGAYRALDEMRAEKRAAQEFESMLADRLFERQMREREFEQRQRYQQEQSQGLAEQRSALAEQRRQNAAVKLSDDLAPGDPLDPMQAGILREAGRGSLMEHQAGELPSRSTMGYLRTGTAAPTGGALRTVASPGRPEQTVYRGTASQRAAKTSREQLQNFVAQLPAGSPERRALEYQLMTGDNPPAGLFQREQPGSFSAIPLYDESGDPYGALSFNQRNGDTRAIELPPGTGIRAGGARRGTLPARVQNFLLQLRTKHPTYDAAQAELAGVLSNAPDESFDRMAAATSLRGLYAQPVGQGDWQDQYLRGLQGGGGAGGSSLLGAPQGDDSGVQSPQAGPVGGAVTRSELQAVAQRLGISVQEAEQQARARGLQVR